MIVLTENRPNRADMISHFGIFEFVALNVFEFQKLLRRVYRNAKPYNFLSFFCYPLHALKNFSILSCYTSWEIRQTLTDVCIHIKVSMFSATL